MTTTIQTFQNINTILLTVFLLIGIIAMTTITIASYKAGQVIINIKKITDIPMFAVNTLIEKFTSKK